MSPRLRLLRADAAAGFDDDTRQRLPLTGQPLIFRCYDTAPSFLRRYEPLRYFDAPCTLFFTLMLILICFIFIILLLPWFIFSPWLSFYTYAITVNTYVYRYEDVFATLCFHACMR